MQRFILIAALLLNFFGCKSAETSSNPPAMGWSSWNTYRVNISDSLIRRQADAMVELGLKDAGYSYINIDDGFFGGRDKVSGKLLIHPERFPDGLAPVVEHIHSLGLKAGIYSDAGRNTCGSFYDRDTIAIGVGLYGHDQQDADFYFNDCKFDFIKIDFCGGDGPQNFENLTLDEKERYTAIRQAIMNTAGHDVRMNICRWNFPGTWACEVGDSWRISHDISPRWSPIKDIIGQNLYLSAYARDGHYNDMDMLEVGRGMSPEEDRTHFGLWCIFSSPLLIGCDLTTVSAETLDLLSNPELIALNQDKLGRQAYAVRNDKGVFLLVKDLDTDHGPVRAVAVYNSSDDDRNFSFDFEEVCLGGQVTVRDVFAREDRGVYRESMEVFVPAHGTRIFRLEAAQRLPQRRYEAETAYLSRYQELTNNRVYKSGIYVMNDSCSAGMAVESLGMTPENDLVWRDVVVPEDGIYECSLGAIGNIDTPFIIDVNGQDIHTVKCGSDLSFKVRLQQGQNKIRIYTSEEAWIPAIDYIDIVAVGS